MPENIRAEMVALLPRLRRFAYSISGSLDEADDLVQTACERALGRLDQFIPGTRLDRWMFRMIQTSWIDRGRYQKRRNQVSDTGFVEALSFDARIYEQTEAKALLARVREEIGRLSDEQRMVLALVVIEDMTYQEAADVLGIRIGTVMSRLARARQKLAEIVDSPRQPKSERRSQ